ncbi:hypothetical protein MPUL_49890 [Mycolicibacterium pulveris]|uniref:DUF2339 domain-containing protein n=1 Tax=Mycolicibacterium pulveris TaxID=36813 RepID=A0A7I7USS9_MYCPV|nr:DUF2339 domain-containing protein [Mycolicibacterium pulveris]BBY83831.1 hypothetical protein MPUL_49890 [Mycolicibacterium pulveris]
MTEPQHVVIARLSADFAAISQYMARVASDLAQLDRVLADRTSMQPVPAPAASYWPQYAQPQYPQSAPHSPPAPAAPPTPRPPRDEGWIGKVLAVAGVAVTLIGVVLLLVLAAQAGILRPEIRVAAGAVLAAGLVGTAGWLWTRPGGRIGAIALAATGVAAAYMDVIAVTTIYDWVSAPVGLVIAAVIGGAGLTLARRWNSEQLGLLVLIPLLVLAPIVVGDMNLLLVAFMLALAAASLPVQLGKDWIWLHAARIAAATVPLLVALVAVSFDDGRDAALAAACGIAAVLAIVAALLLAPWTANRVAMALLTAAGVLPVLCVGLAADRLVAAAMAAALSAALLAIVLLGRGLPAVAGAARQVWAVLAAVAALIAVLVAFDGHIAGPVLLAMALVVAVTGRAETVARWTAVGFAVVGGGIYLSYAPPDSLIEATATTPATGISTVVASLLLIACAVVIVWSFPDRDSTAWAGAAIVVVYALTALTVTAGVLIGGEGGGFFGGHMAATICWIALAAALFGYAARVPRADRSLPIGGGLALVAAAMAKLFLFDLGTLDGIFRVVVFIVVGLVLLGMGAGYARLLERQDQQKEQSV